MLKMLQSQIETVTRQIEQEVANGELLVKKTEDSTRQSSLCFAWQRGSQGKALDWWTQHLATVHLNFQPPQ